MCACDIVLICDCESVYCRPGLCALGCVRLHVADVLIPPTGDTVASLLAAVQEEENYEDAAVEGVAPSAPLSSLAAAPFVLTTPDARIPVNVTSTPAGVHAVSCWAVAGVVCLLRCVCVCASGTSRDDLFWCASVCVY